MRIARFQLQYFCWSFNSILRLASALVTTESLWWTPIVNEELDAKQFPLNKVVISRPSGLLIIYSVLFHHLRDNATSIWSGRCSCIQRWSTVLNLHNRRIVSSIAMMNSLWCHDTRFARFNEKFELISMAKKIDSFFYTESEIALFPFCQREKFVQNNFWSFFLQKTWCIR